MEDLTSRTIAVFSRPFTVPDFAETLPAGEYEIETELVPPPHQLDPDAWKASVRVKLHPRMSQPGVARTLTVSLADLNQARARDKMTGRDLADFYLEEMLADPMTHLVMQADGVSEAHLRHLYAAPGTPEGKRGQARQDDPPEAEAGRGAETSGSVSPNVTARAEMAE